MAEGLTAPEFQAQQRTGQAFCVFEQIERIELENAKLYVSKLETQAERGRLESVAYFAAKERIELQIAQNMAEIRALFELVAL